MCNAFRSRELRGVEGNTDRTKAFDRGGEIIREKDFGMTSIVRRANVSDEREAWIEA